MLMALLVLAAAGAVQVRDAPATKSETPTGRVTGRVVAADTGRPVAHAFVSAVRDGEAHGRVQVVADEQGSFAFDALPAGRYVFTGGKTGAFLPAEFGQPRFDLPGSTVTVPAGAELTIELRLPRAGVIAGRVMDENGDPLPLVSLALVGRRHGMRVTPIAGTNPEGLLRTTQSNDLGEFRFFGLPPDDYLVIATPPTLARERRREAPVYYPGVSDPAQAHRLQLGPGQQITGTDFIVRTVATVKVSGIALGPDGTPVPSGTVSLHATVLDGAKAIAQLAAIKDGAFSFEAAPGTYLLRARHPKLRDDSPYAGDLTGAIPLAIGEDGLAGIQLALGYGASVRGRLVVEGGSLPRLREFRLLIESGVLGEVRTAVVGGVRTYVADAEVAARGILADGREFTITGIEGGARRLIVQGPPGLILKGVYAAGVDVTDEPLELAEGTTISDVRVVFTEVKSPLSVTVAPLPSDGGALVVFRESPEGSMHPSRLQIVPIGSGTITLDSLTQGPYLVVALANVSVRSLRPDAGLFHQLRPLAVRVELVEGHDTRVTVQPVRLPR